MAHKKVAQSTIANQLLQEESDDESIISVIISTYICSLVC